MSLVQDIAATWRGPGRVVARLMTIEAREGRALYFLLMACILIFVARAPVEARIAALDPEGAPLAVRLLFMALAVLLLVPAVMYALGAAAHGVLRLMGRGAEGFSGARLALFWALLALSPLTLAMGAVAGLAGNGMALALLTWAWVAVFVWFAGAGLAVAARPGVPA